MLVHFYDDVDVVFKHMLKSTRSQQTRCGNTGVFMPLKAKTQPSPPPQSKRSPP